MLLLMTIWCKATAFCNGILTFAKLNIIVVYMGFLKRCNGYVCRWLLLSLSVFLFTYISISCDKEDDISTRYKFVTAKDGSKLIVRTDTFTYLSGIDSVIPDKPSGVTDVEHLNRFIESYTEDRCWINTKLGDWCVKYGLSTDSTYLSKRRIYSQYIPGRKGYVAIPFVPTIDQMGFQHNDSRNTIGFYGGYGIIPIKGVYGNCWTVIFDVKYDTQGNEINLYYPCCPEQLKWHYYWYKL